MSPDTKTKEEEFLDRAAIELFPGMLARYSDPRGMESHAAQDAYEAAAALWLARITWRRVVEEKRKRQKAYEYEKERREMGLDAR